jgi:hypothetical protein
MEDLSPVADEQHESRRGGLEFLDCRKVFAIVNSFQVDTATMSAMVVTMGLAIGKDYPADHRVGRNTSIVAAVQFPGCLG